MVCARAGDPIDLQRIQNECMRTALEEQRVLIAKLTSEVMHLRADFHRRTYMLSPAKGFSNERYAQTLTRTTATNPTATASNAIGLGIPITNESSTQFSSYLTSEAPATHSEISSPVITLQIDLVLPPQEAFATPGMAISQ